MKREPKKHDIGDVWTIEAAEMVYEKRGIASIITDGRYVQMEKEPTSRPAK